MSKKKENPDLTQEFRAQQELHKKMKKEANNAPNYPNQPYYPNQNQNGYYNGYQGYPSQPPYPQQNPQYTQPSPAPSYPQEAEQEEVKEDIVEEEYIEEPRRKKHKRKSRVKEYGNGRREVVVDDVEKQYHSKQRKRMIIRGGLIIVNFALLAYLCLCVVDLVFDLRNTSNVTADSYITVCGKSRKDSEAIYKSYLGDNEATLANDYALYGDDLYLSSTRINGNNLSSFGSLFVSNVCSGEDDRMFLSQDGPIDISSYDDGDYIITTTAEQRPIKYSGSQSVLYTYYTLPNEDGLRKRITIKNNSSSPLLVLSMKTIEDLPEDYYDIVYYVEEGNQNLIPTIEGITSKVIYTTSGLKDVYLTNSSYAFDLTGSSYLSSNFDISYEGYAKDTTAENRQSNQFIREIGGYITGANSCIDESTCILNSYFKTEHVGKKAFVLNKTDSADNIRTHIQTVINNN